jgi:hypothetical protein
MRGHLKAYEPLRNSLVNEVPWERSGFSFDTWQALTENDSSGGIRP